MKRDDKSVDFGRTLKHFRLSRGITIKQLGEATGLSSSFLSLLENNKTDISFSNMQKILQFFNLTIADLSKHQPADGKTVRLNDAKSVTKVRLADAGFIGPDEHGMIILELVKDKKKKKMWPGYFIMKPGAVIGPMQHKGEEFSHVIQGIIEVHLTNPKSGEEEIHLLHKGDTIYYPSSYLHTYKNLSKGDSIFLAAVTPPTF
ncbi:MAG: XRE family transcriptional regulator [Smithella sp.]